MVAKSGFGSHVTGSKGNPGEESKTQVGTGTRIQIPNCQTQGEVLLMESQEQNQAESGTGKAREYKNRKVH